MLGMSQTKSVQMSISVGKAISVVVRPKREMTMPVPNSENRNEIELVVCTAAPTSKRKENKISKHRGVNIKINHHSQIHFSQAQTRKKQRKNIINDRLQNSC